MAQPALHIRNLGLRLSEDFAVVIEAMDLAAGERVVLDAVSGAGKSTALGLVAGALASSDLPGEVHELAGQAVDRSQPRGAWAGPGVLGFVLQTNALVPYLDVGENITLPARVARLAPDPAWHDDLIARLGIGDLLRRRSTAVSVGQRQRVSIARALLARPKLLLLDEPVSALDPANVDEVEALIDQLASEAGAAVVLASHQAQTGAFADTPRMQHRLERRGGVTTSIFAEPLRAPLEAVI